MRLQLKLSAEVQCEVLTWIFSLQNNYIYWGHVRFNLMASKTVYIIMYYYFWCHNHIRVVSNPVHGFGVRDFLRVHNSVLVDMKLDSEGFDVCFCQIQAWIRPISGKTSLNISGYSKKMFDFLGIWNFKLPIRTDPNPTLCYPYPTFWYPLPA